MEKQKEPFEVGIVIKIDEDTNLALKQRILDYERDGIRLTKAEIVKRMILIGLKASKRSDDENND